MDSLTPYDAVVLLSFGGPEAPEDVVPFLQNVTRGRGIPPERLEEVGEHYFARGGRSPINDLNRQLLADLRAELDRRDVAAPVYWGNRNWAPYLTDVLREAHDAGHRRVLVLTTSAYASYSSCRQYREDVAGALITLAEQGRSLRADKVRAYFNHPGFVAGTVDGVLAALGELGAGAGAAAGAPENGPASGSPLPRVVFVTHSIPTAMADTSGPDGGAYVAEHEDVATTVVTHVAKRLGLDADRIGWDLVYCSRSGPPTQPWLEPDINDHLRALASAGETAVVVVPVGFVSDHMEVVHDLDTEAAETAREAGLRFARAATAGSHPEFVAGLVDLLVERARAERGESPDRPATGALGPTWDVCPAGCCPNLRTPERPAACGADWSPNV
ncbi:MAG TPA: ferrochelatase [Actinomycetales bacterium]|nr:ferrochelatase [Actinomycetales bacterium]